MLTGSTRCLNVLLPGDLRDYWGPWAENLPSPSATASASGAEDEKRSQVTAW
jgi:hypothetical protein